MKRFFFIIAALLLSAGIASYGSTAVPLTVGILDPSSTSSGPGKTPVFIPSLWQEGHELTFQVVHAGYAIDIVQNGIVIYSVDVEESTSSVMLPSWLLGDFEILLYPVDSSYYFYGIISL